MAWNDLTNPEAWKVALANLLRKGEDVGTYVSEAPTKAGQAILEGHAKNQELWQKAHANPQRPFQVTDQNAFNELTDRYLGGVLSVAPMGITAWHGSPHKFDQFDISKVGTGEGAQSYGHGMYFAENPEVAKGYKKALTEKGRGSLYKVDIPDEHIATMMDWDKPLGEQSEFVKKAINNLKKQVTPEMKMELGDDLNLLFGKDITPNQFLNTWEIIHPTGGVGIGEKLLNEQGVKGIKYSDAGSRTKNIFDEEMARLRNKYKDDFEAAANDYIRTYHDTPAKKAKMKEYVMEVLAKKPTSNFVVFDPSTVQVLERNGRPVRKQIIEEQINKLKD